MIRPAIIFALLLVVLAILSTQAGAVVPLVVIPDYQVPRAAAPWKRAYIKATREVWGLNTPAWLAAQVGQESSWRDGLVSTAAARGMCQFIEGTAIGVEKQNAGLARLGRYSPAWCFKAQSILMRQLFLSYDEVRDDCNAIKFAGSAYNGGPGMLAREVALCRKIGKTCHYEHWSHVAPMNARAGWAWRENRDYVFRITTRSGVYAEEGWGADFCAPAPAPIEPPADPPRTMRTPEQ